MPLRMSELVIASGVSVDFDFKRKPKNQSGTLNELAEDGLLEGFVNAAEVGWKFVKNDDTD